MTMRVSCKGLTDHDLILSRRLKTPRDKDGNLLTKKSTQLGTTEQLVSALREAIFARSPVTSQGWRRAFVEFRKKSGRQRSTGVWWQESSQESGVSLDEFAKGDMVIRLQCGHVFHDGCILSWLKSDQFSPSCPICKSDPLEDRSCLSSFVTDVRRCFVANARRPRRMPIRGDMHMV